VLIDGVLRAVGKTPLVRLKRMFPRLCCAVYAKLELMNPGGSSKDRAALHMLRTALEAGRIKRGDLIVESSSGNMGIGLAQACRYFGLRLTCVVDSRTTDTNRRILEAYGAELIVVDKPDSATGDLLDARLARVRAILAATPGAFWPDQYGNNDNANAHYATTAAEVMEDLGRAPDAIFCAVSTCGTIGGLARFIRERGEPTQLFAVDAVGSAIFGAAPGVRRIPGIGSSHKPRLLDRSEVKPVYVNDSDCVIGCRRLVEREAILAGGSSGGVVMAASRVCTDLPKDALVVVILPDRGERYLDSVFSNDWVSANVGDPATLFASEEL
jgi:cysteine synthase A